MTAAERDRNTALAIARRRARAGDELGAWRWLDVARQFAEPTRRQLAAYQRALAAGAPVVIPGQLELADALELEPAGDPH